MDKECFDEALKQLTSISREDLKQYLHDVNAKAYEYDPNGGTAAFDRAISEVNNETMESFFETANQNARNVQKLERLKNIIIKGKNTLRDVLAKRFNVQADNVPSYQKSAANRLQNAMFGEFDRDTMEYFSSGKNDDVIAQELDGINTSDAKAKFIADKMNAKYIPYRNDEMVISGALKSDEIRGDRMLRQVHDQQKIISGGKSLIQSAKDFVKRYEGQDNKKLWIDFFKKDLNLKETFKFTDALIKGEVDDSKVNEIMGRTFDNISTGKSDILTQSTVVRDADAVKKKSRMFFVFKDWQSFLHYNKQYGKGNLFGALISDIHGSGNKIGLAESLGTSPYTMYNELVKAQMEKNPKDGWWWDNTENYFKTLLGNDKQTRSPSKATFAANIRTVTSMARLFSITGQSISDIGYNAAFAQRWGVNYFSAWTTHLKNIFDKIPNEERQYLGKLFKLNVDSHLGFMGRFIDATNTGDLINKVSTRYFKAIQLEAFDRGNKISAMHIMAKNLFNNSTKRFGDLNPSLQKQLGKFLTEQEWDLLRKNNSGKMFTTDNVDNLTNEQLKQFHTDTNSTAPLYELKNDLYRKVYSMFDIAAENSVLTPGVFERAWCYRGTAPGTLSGEIWRTISQFKMYTMAYIDRVLVNGWKDADTYQQKLTWGISMLMGTLPLSVLSSHLGYLADGLSPPDPNQMTIAQREAYLTNLLTPSLAIFSGIVDPNNQNSSMVLSMLGSPATRLISDSLASGTATASGDGKHAKKLFYNAAKYILPLQNVPIVSSYLSKAMGEHAQLQPGQHPL